MQNEQRRARLNKTENPFSLQDDKTIDKIYKSSLEKNQGTQKTLRNPKAL